jgi:hypothetical protein
MATRVEIARQVRAKYPDIPEENLKKAVDYFVKNPDAFKEFPKKGMLPTAAMTKLSGEVITPGKVVAKAGAVVGAGVKGVKAVGRLAGTAIPKTPAGKVDIKKTAKRTGLLGLAGFAVGAFTGDDGTDAAAQQQAIADQANTDLMMGMAQYEAAGGDVNALLNTAAGQQLMKNPNFNIGAIMGSQDTLVGGAGVYTGKPQIVSSAPPSFAGGRPIEVKSDTISLTQWNKQFPMANPKALAEWKSNLKVNGKHGVNFH